MATRTPGVLGAFEHVDAALDTIRGLRKAGHRDLTVYSAAPNHEIEEAMAHPVSRVRLFTLIGGITGCLAGYFMTDWMSLDWPILVGGKPISTVPPYVVIMFELTVLIGALSTVAGMLILPRLRKGGIRPFHPRFTDDQIGVFAPCGAEQRDQVAGLMRRAGAVEVTHEG